MIAQVFGISFHRRLHPRVASCLSNVLCDMGYNQGSIVVPGCLIYLVTVPLPFLGVIGFAIFEDYRPISGDCPSIWA